MAETLPSARDLRAQAREHRGKAVKLASPEQRRTRLVVAREYERLADAIETEHGTSESAGERACRSQKHPRRILVVEDEFVTALLIEDLLHESGCDVVGPVARPDVAIETLAGERVDAALLDVRLGAADCRAVASKLDELGIPFGFVTGYGSGGDTGVYRTRPKLAKPFGKAEICSLLDRLLRSKVKKAAR